MTDNDKRELKPGARVMVDGKFPGTIDSEFTCRVRCDDGAVHDAAREALTPISAPPATVTVAVQVVRHKHNNQLGTCTIVSTDEDFTEDSIYWKRDNSSEIIVPRHELTYHGDKLVAKDDKPCRVAENVGGSWSRVGDGLVEFCYGVPNSTGDYTRVFGKAEIPVLCDQLVRYLDQLHKQGEGRVR